jgi:putative oxidoreductase
MIIRLHDAVFAWLQRALEDWVLGLLARLVFAGVLFMYFFRSAQTKVADGLSGFFTVTDGAYVQILPKVMERVGYDTSQIELFPWGWMVYAGTYAEFVLPVLIVLGLATRLAALGMIGFVAVQTYVDIFQHAVTDDTIGAWFDKDPSALIADQRALWVMLLAYLVLRGAGAVSLDGVLSRRRARA